MTSINAGDIVICDLDGRHYTVVASKDRNLVEKSDANKPPKLIGNVLTLRDELGNTVHVYDWEVTKEN